MCGTPGNSESSLAEAQRWVEAKGMGAVGEVRVLLCLRAPDDGMAATRRRLDDLALRFARRLDATGVSSLLSASDEDCEAFLWTPTRRNQVPSIHTVYLRRTALRMVFKALAELEPEAGDPTRTLGLPPKPEDRTRPLTAGELDLVRTVALGRARRPLRAASLVALAEATATTGELPRVHWTDLDLAAGTVALPGASPINPRTATLTAWGIGVLGRWKATTPHPPDDPVAGPPSAGATDYAAQAAMSSALNRLITSAGVTGPGVRPSSIRLRGGAIALAESGIEAAARALGYDSLDAAAAALGHDWNTRP